MTEPLRVYDFTRYLAAKRTVDDRALNPRVWDAFRAALPPEPLRYLEIGAGTGAMIERLAGRGLLGSGIYTAIDAERANIAAAAESETPFALGASVELEAIDLFDFARRESGVRRWDALIAHAFLDLVDAPSTLPLLWSLLRPGAPFYFTINFDGLTALEPAIDPAFDEQVIALYHRTMDERLVGGRPSGDSRSGRRLLGYIPASGGEILAAGASDWVVLPQGGGYPADEAYFLHHIIHFFETSLAGHAELDGPIFADWCARRHEQIDAGELIYLAHQLDIAGRAPA